MTTIELNSIAHDLLAVKQLIAELEAEAEALTDRIKTEMTERGQEVLTGDTWKASWKNVTSSRFDSKRFKTDHSDLYGAYTKQTTTCRFLIGA